MTAAPSLVRAAEDLADALAAENAALRSVDFAGVGAMLPGKEAALAALRAAAASTEQPTATIRRAVLRLRAEADENRRLLQRAMRVQTRVIGVVAGAGRPREAGGRYSRTGAYSPAPLAVPALSARA
jgi:hypothetical protein